MINIPNLKESPVVVALLTMTFLLVFGVACAFGGWWLRIASESRAELAVVLDDAKFMKHLDEREVVWAEVYNDRMEQFYKENPSIPDCLAEPMPQAYHDNDVGLHPELVKDPTNPTIIERIRNVLQH